MNRVLTCTFWDLTPECTLKQKTLGEFGLSSFPTKRQPRSSHTFRFAVAHGVPSRQAFDAQPFRSAGGRLGGPKLSPRKRLHRKQEIARLARSSPPP